MRCAIAIVEAAPLQNCKNRRPQAAVDQRRAASGATVAELSQNVARQTFLELALERKQISQVVENTQNQCNGMERLEQAIVRPRQVRS